MSGRNFKSLRAVARRRMAPRAAGLVLALPLLSACTSPMAPATPALPAVNVTTSELVGKWGLAAYRVDTDIDRTKAEAKRACSNPYVIANGPAGGVMMHLADQSTPTEVVLKTATDGRVFVGPAGKPGDKHDRWIVS